MARAPASAPSPNITPEVLAARMDTFTDVLSTLSKDVREVRDATVKLEAKLSAENTKEELAKVWARVEANANEHRQDLQNAISHVHARFVPLEEWKSASEGAKSWRGAVAQHMPWIIAIGALAVSTVGMIYTVAGALHHG